MQLKNGWKLTYIDEVAGELLNEEIFLNIILPRLPERGLLEQQGKLGPREIFVFEQMSNEEPKIEQQKIDSTQNQDEVPKKKKRRKILGLKKVKGVAEEAEGATS